MLEPRGPVGAPFRRANWAIFMVPHTAHDDLSSHRYVSDMDVTSIHHRILYDPFCYHPNYKTKKYHPNYNMMMMLPMLLKKKKERVRSTPHSLVHRLFSSPFWRVQTSTIAVLTMEYLFVYFAQWCAIDEYRITEYYFCTCKFDFYEEINTTTLAALLSYYSLICEYF